MSIWISLFLVCGTIAVAFGVVALVVSSDKMRLAVVQDTEGNPTGHRYSPDKARGLVEQGKTTMIKQRYPMTIRMMK